MSATILFGESKLAGALQEILDVNNAPILDVDDVAITSVYPELTLGTIDDVDGNPILDVAASPILGIVGAAAPPKYWGVADVSLDGGVPFQLLHEDQPFQPSGQAGERVFSWAYLTFSWSMGATIRVTATVDGNADPVTLPDGSTLENVTSVFTLAQQAGSLQRLSAVFPVPVARAHIRDGVEVARYWLRGERVQFTIETTGPLGTGELMLDGIALESQPVRKAIYQPVQS